MRESVQSDLVLAGIEAVWPRLTCLGIPQQKQRAVPCYPHIPSLCVAQFLTPHKVASVLEDPTSHSLHGQSQDFFGFMPDAVYGICLAAPS